MRKVIALLLALLSLVAVFGSCTAKTPDVVASEAAAAITLETLDWSIEVEGAEKTSYGINDAKQHELSKMIVSMVISVIDGNMSSARKSFRVDGINFSEFLADVGASNATKATVYGRDLYGAEVTFVVEGDNLQSPDCKIAWIRNIEEVLPDSENYVGLFGGNSVSEFDGCCDIYKIVIE